MVVVALGVVKSVNSGFLTTGSTVSSTSFAKPISVRNKRGINNIYDDPYAVAAIACQRDRIYRHTLSDLPVHIGYLYKRFAVAITRYAEIKYNISPLRPAVVAAAVLFFTHVLPPIDSLDDLSSVSPDDGPSASLFRLSMRLFQFCNFSFILFREFERDEKNNVLTRDLQQPSTAKKIKTFSPS